jgi:hypothetical protein
MSIFGKLVALNLFIWVVFQVLFGIILEFNRVCVSEARKVVVGVLQFIIVKQEVFDDQIYLGFHPLRGFVQKYIPHQIQTLDFYENPLGLEIFASNKAANTPHHTIPNLDILLLPDLLNKLKRPNPYGLFLYFRVVLIGKTKHSHRNYSVFVVMGVEDDVEYDKVAS